MFECTEKLLFILLSPPTPSPNSRTTRAHSTVETARTQRNQTPSSPNHSAQSTTPLIPTPPPPPLLPTEGRPSYLASYQFILRTAVAHRGSKPDPDKLFPLSKPCASPDFSPPFLRVCVCVVCLVVCLYVMGLYHDGFGIGCQLLHKKSALIFMRIRIG